MIGHARYQEPPTEEVLRIVDRMGGYEAAVRHSVATLDLGDDDNGLPFVIGRGSTTPAVGYDRRQRIIVTDDAALRTRHREATATARMRAEATGHIGQLDTIEEWVESEDTPTPPTSSTNPAGPTVRDRWGGNTIQFGYKIEFPDWVMKALE